MAFTDMQSFMRVLEARGLLKRVTAPVNAELEVTEIATRLVREGGPAVLFENVEGASYPLVVNLLGTMERIEIGLGRHPEEIGENLITFLEDVNPPSVSSLWRNRGSAFNLLNVRPGLALNSRVQQVTDTLPDLSQMPILKCWPEDGGRFITLPLVRTRDPATGAHNMGMYRMQVYDASTTGMHMQIQKGGAFHHVDAERDSKPLDIAVALGGDPALILSAIIPLPEGIDEAGFAGVMRGKPTPMVKAKTVDVRVPAHAEFRHRRTADAERTSIGRPVRRPLRTLLRRGRFPRFARQSHHPASATQSTLQPSSVSHRKKTGALGDAAQLATKPLIRLMRKEVRDMWSYYESGFHNLLVVSVDSRYSREQMKTAFGILGEGQLSLTKVMVLVDSQTGPSDIKSVARAISRNFRVETDFRLLVRTAQDTLDFTGDAFQHGSKMVLDATGYGHEPERIDGPQLRFDPTTISPSIAKHRLICDNILVLQIRNGYPENQNTHRKGSQRSQNTISKGTDTSFGRCRYRRRRRANLGHLHPLRLRAGCRIHRAAFRRHHPHLQRRNGHRRHMEAGLPETT